MPKWHLVTLFESINDPAPFCTICEMRPKGHSEKIIFRTSALTMEVLVVCHLFLISQMIISVVFLYIQFLLVVGICPFHTDERCTWVPKHYSRPSPTEVRRDKIQQELMPLVTDMIHHAYNSYRRPPLIVTPLKPKNPEIVTIRGGLTFSGI